MRLAGSIMLAIRFLGFGSLSAESNARKSLYGAAAGIGLSLIPLIVVLVVANGMIEGISSRIIELSSSHLRVEDYAGVSAVAESPAAMERLARSLVEGDESGMILDAWAERSGTGIVIGPRGRSGGTLRAVEPSFLTDNPGVENLLKPVSGTLDLSDRRAALLGDKLAEETGLAVGDRFRILTLAMRPDGSTIPKFSLWTVAGIVSSGYRELDALWVFLPHETGSAIMDRSSSSTFVNVRTPNAFRNLESARYSLLSRIPDGFNVYGWEELNRSQFQSFNTTRTLLMFIMFLIVLVATVNVSSALVMLVMERKRDIAILKSCGTDSETISFAFVLSGFLTGLGGVVTGVPLGVLAAVNVNALFSLMERILNAANRFWYIIEGAGGDDMPKTVRVLDPEYYLQTIPVTLNVRDLFLIAFATLILSVLVSFLPASRGAREKPLETLRKY